jgi:hypothetical protein
MFLHIHVRGPFHATHLQTLQQRGIQAFPLSAPDRGWYSPMKTMADSLRLVVAEEEENSSSLLLSSFNRSLVRGVIMIHDDLLLNISHLVQRFGFPWSGSTILTTIQPEVLSKPLVKVYANQTFQLISPPPSSVTAQGNRGYKIHKSNTSSSRLLSVQGKHLRRLLPAWSWWKNVLLAASEAAANTTRINNATTSTVLDHIIGKDGSISLYGNGLSDFLYVPISLAEPFGTVADFMTAHSIFLEVGTPTILGAILQQQRTQQQVHVRSTNICTTMVMAGRHNKFKRMDVPTTLSTAMTQLQSCLQNWTGQHYGVYHPVKMKMMGTELWDKVFDSIVLGKSTANWQAHLQELKQKVTQKYTTET